MKRILTLLALATLATAGESSCLLNKFCAFAKTGWKNATTLLAKRSTKVAIGGFIPLGLATIIGIEQYKSHRIISDWTRLSGGKELNAEIARLRAKLVEQKQEKLWLDKVLLWLNPELDKNHLKETEKPVPPEVLEALEKIKKLTLDIEKKTQTPNLKWYIKPEKNGEVASCSPLSRKIFIPLNTNYNQNYSTASDPEKLRALLGAALHEAGHIQSRTQVLEVISEDTGMLSGAAYILSCIACPPARILALPLRLVLSKIVGGIAQLQWTRCEEKKADTFLARYLLEAFKKGDPNALRILEATRNWFIKVHNEECFSVDTLVEAARKYPLEVARNWPPEINRDQQARTGLDEMIEGVRKNPHLRTAVKVIGLLPRGIVWTIIDPHHPKVEKRVQKLQRYVDLCIKHACAKKVTQQRIQSLHELRGVLPD
jgi:hypothetical protein